MKRGSIKEAQATILEMLSDCFEEIPAALREAVQNLEDLSRLRNLRQVLQVASLDEWTRFLHESINPTSK